MEEIIIKDFKHFGGKHCQTGALKNILDYHKLHLSEEMLLGLGGGIGFIYWYMKGMSSPFVGGRFGGKGEIFLVNICRRIGAEANLFQTTSVKRGHEQLKKILDKGEPAYLFVDMAYLPYFAVPETAHFGGHTIVVFGLDEKEDKVYISDRGNNFVTITIEELKKARNSKFPPFPPKNKILNIKYPSKIGNLEKGIIEGIKESTKNMMDPPIRNFGLAGIKKWAELVPKWPEQFKGIDLLGCLLCVFIYIEVGGTGGGFFRPMYAKFLEEASSILNRPALKEIAELFEDSGKVWSEIATAALPDSWFRLKRIRELSFEKNRIFEESKPEALEKMRKINIEIENLLKREEEESVNKDLASLLANLQEKILKCYKIEKEAFESLKSIINRR
jgi:hypothetical protein